MNLTSQNSAIGTGKPSVQRPGPPRKFIAGAIFLALFSGTAFGVDSDGLLKDFLIDASQGDFTQTESSAFISLLDQFQLAGYELSFSDGESIPLSLTTEGLEAALAGEERVDAI